MKFLQLFLCALILCCGVAAHAAPIRAVFFGFKLEDTSLEGEMNGPSTAETARVQMLDRLLEQKLTEAGYQLISTAPIAAELKKQDLVDCEGCAASLARQLGAEVSVIGWVQKVSNLILNINIVMRDAQTGKMVRAGSVSIRSNTDESWRRGLDYLLAEKILPKGEALAR
jgi:hypothetical protein